MESLEAKTNQLKATFETLANNVISKELITTLLELANNVLKLLDTKIGRAITQFSLLSGVLTGFITIAGAIIPKLLGIGAAAGTAATGVGALMAVAAPAAAIIAALALAGYNLYSAYKKAHPSVEELTERLKGNQTELQATEDKLKELNSIPWEKRTSEIQAEIDELREYKKELQEVVKQESIQRAEAQAAKIAEIITDIGYTVTDSFGHTEVVGTIEELNDLFNETFESFEQAKENGFSVIPLKDYEDAKEVLSDMLDRVYELSAKTEKTKEEQTEYNDLIKQLGDWYDKYKLGLNYWAEASKYSHEGTQGLIDYNTIWGAIGNSIGWVTGRTKVAASETGKLGRVTNSSAKSFEELKAEANSAAMAVDNVKAQEILLNNTNLDLSQQITALQQLASQAGLAATSIALVAGATGAQRNYSDKLRDLMSTGNYTYAQAKELAQQSVATETWNRLQTELDKTKQDTAPAGGGGGGGDPKLEALQNIVKLRESELDILEKQEASETQRIEKIKEIQNALHNEAEYLRTTKKYIDGDAETLEKVNKLSASWLDYNNKINDILNEVLKKEKEIEAEELQKQIDAYGVLAEIVQEEADNQIDLLNKQLEAFEAINDSLDKQIEQEEKLDAIARARQSKVMVFKDGRFQYVEDVDAISSAEEAYAEFEREKAREEYRKQIEEQISAIEEYKNQWSELADSYDKESDRQLALERLHIDAENANWDEMLKNAADFVAKYKTIMSELTQTQSEITALDATSASGVDWSALWKEAQENKNLTAEQRKTLQDYYHAQKVKEMESLGKKYDPNTGKWYASGTTSAAGGLSVVGEHGAELRVLNQGDGILPADVTKNLWSWGSMTPKSFINSLPTIKGKFGSTMMVTINDLNLPNVHDGEGFVDYLRNNLFGQAMSFVH